MQFNRVGPCGNCPFLCDRSFGLRSGRMRGIVYDLLHGDKTFACHKTTGRGPEREQFCAGAGIFLQKIDMLFSGHPLRLAAMLGLFDPDKLRDDPRIVGDVRFVVENAERIPSAHVPHGGNCSDVPGRDDPFWKERSSDE